jgi:hypothetical protein
MIVHHKSVT